MKKRETAITLAEEAGFSLIFDSTPGKRHWVLRDQRDKKAPVQLLDAKKDIFAVSEKRFKILFLSRDGKQTKVKVKSPIKKTVKIEKPVKPKSKVKAKKAPEIDPATGALKDRSHVTPEIAKQAGDIMNWRKALGAFKKDADIN